MIVAACSGCATVKMPNVTENGYALQDDERRLMKRSDEFAEILESSGHIYKDEKLEAYLNDIAQGLLADYPKIDTVNITVKVIRDPYFNAVSLPNGRVYVHTGILAVIENEAQLATLLAHEMTHVLNRHAFKQFRSMINKSAFMSWAGITASVAVGDLANIFIQGAVISSVYGFSQTLEYEADESGFRMLVDQGYDVRESQKLFEHLQDSIKEEDVKQPFFFSTHPKVASRVKKYAEMVSELTQEQWGTEVNTSEYQTVIKDIILENARLALEQGIFKVAERNINTYIASYPQDYRGFYYKGELYRQRQDARKGKKKREKTEDYKLSLQAFDQAINLSPKYALAYKGKGRVLQKQNQQEDARQIYRQYLELNPEAEDKSYIEQFLKGE